MASYTQDFVRGSAERQGRSVTRTGAIVIVVLAIVVTTVAWLYPRLNAPPGIDVALEVPFIGPGVTSGTKVLLRGAPVGEVVDVDNAGQQSVRIHLVLKPEEIRGLTDTFQVDYRPANYFGTTGINLVAKPGGRELSSGATFARVPLGDFTMSTMIEQASLVVDGTLTDDMVRSLDKVVRYTEGLTPLIETGIIVANKVAQTQRHLPSELFGRTNDMLEQMPELARGMITMLFAVYQNKPYNRRPDGSFGTNVALMDQTNDGLDLAAGQLFGLAGTLLASHPGELVPLTNTLTQITDLVPVFISNGVSPNRLTRLLANYNRALAHRGDRRVLKVKVVVDNFPALAGPLSMLGTTTQTKTNSKRGGR